MTKYFTQTSYTYTRHHQYPKKDTTYKPSLNVQQSHRELQPTSPPSTSFKFRITSRHHKDSISKRESTEQRLLKNLAGPLRPSRRSCMLMAVNLFFCFTPLKSPILSSLPSTTVDISLLSPNGCSSCNARSRLEENG